MSSGLVGQVIEHYPGNGDELLLAIIIADNATRSGAVLSMPPSELARLARRSEKTVRRTLAKMEEARWLVCVERSKGGHKRPTIYQINPDWVKLPIGWHAEKPGQIDQVEPGQIDQVSRQQPGQIDQVEPGHNLDNLSMFPRETAPFFEGHAMGLKAFPPVVPQFDLTPDTGDGGNGDIEAQDLRLAHWMLERLRTLNPKHRAPANWGRWTKDIRLLRTEVAGLTHRRMAEVFLWANNDRMPRPGSTFCWAKQILSPGNLRAKWDRLVLDAVPPAAKAKSDSPLCEDCGVRPWTRQQGKTGKRRCGPCAELAEARAA